MDFTINYSETEPTEPIITVQQAEQYTEYTIEELKVLIDQTKKVYWQAKKMRRDAQSKARKDAHFGRLLAHEVTVGVADAV